MLVAGSFWLLGGVVIYWRSADVAAFYRSTYRRLHGSGRYGELAQRTTTAASFRVVAFGFCGMGLLLILGALWVW